jgi:phosphoadenosine phosphosulfate reductase
MLNHIQYSIDLLQRHETTALKMNPEGYYVAFSGGKDSQVIYELCKMAGVKFQAHFNCTTVDPKEVLRFIRLKYPDVIWHRPVKSMFKLIEENKSLPTRQIRYCCRLIKEVAGINSIVITGVRKEESNFRGNHMEIKLQCINGQDKLMIAPILNWTNYDVWEFIKTHIGYWCELYDKGFKRIGCVGCPNSYYKSKQKLLEVAPKFEYAYKKAIRKCIANGRYSQFIDEHEVFDWWMSGKSVKQYFGK